MRTASRRTGIPGDIALGRLVFHDARPWLQDMVFSKVSLRPGRLVASAVTFTFLFLLVSLFWRQIRRVLGGLLVPLGQHALYAYTAHIVIAALLALALAPLHLAYPGPGWLNAGFQAGSVFVIWLLVKCQFLMPTPRTERAWYVVPAVSFVAVLVLLTAFPRPAHPGLEEPAVEASAQGRTPTRFGTPIPAEEAAAILPPALPPVLPGGAGAATHRAGRARRPATATPVVTPAAGSQPTARGHRRGPASDPHAGAVDSHADPGAATDLCQRS